MTIVAEQFAGAAETLVGTRFRLHGRDPETGLDCIGLVGCALEACGKAVRYPRGYRLRNADIARWLDFAGANGLHGCRGMTMRGDVLLIRPGPAQHHLLVALGADRFVHAHAGLRRVVAQHIAAMAAPLAHWRLQPELETPWQR